MRETLHSVNTYELLFLFKSMLECRTSLYIKKYVKTLKDFINTYDVQFTIIPVDNFKTYLDSCTYQ